MFSTLKDRSDMGLPRGTSSMAQSLGPRQQQRLRSQTAPFPGQQICHNYIRGIACHKGASCKYFHDDIARSKWPQMSKKGKRVASEACNESKKLGTTNTTATSGTILSGAQTALQNQHTAKLVASQAGSTLDISPSVASITTTPPTDYVPPHLRHRSNGSSNGSPSSSVDSAVGRISFEDWNKQRAEIAASTTAQIGGITNTTEHNLLERVSGQSFGESSASAKPILFGSNGIGLATNSVAPLTVAGVLPFEAGLGAKPDGITDEMWAFMKERYIKNLSISTISSDSSRASRKSLNITSKVMGFIHRRVNSSAAPAPLDCGHPAYDGSAENPRVCLPGLVNRQASPRKARSPLGQEHSGFGLGIIPETLPVNNAHTATRDPVVRKYQGANIFGTHDKSAAINSWMNAAAIIAADDEAIKEATVIKAKEDASIVKAKGTKSPYDFSFKFIPRSTTMNTPGELQSKNNLLSHAAIPSESASTTISKSSNEMVQDDHMSAYSKANIKSETTTYNNPKDVAILPTFNTASVQDDLCINYIRGYSCYFKDGCEKYHDEVKRDAAIMHPCVEYNSGQLCSNRKTCTRYHDQAVHNKNRTELTRKAAAAMIGYSKVPKNVPRCLEFALGHECPRKANCTLYHDTVFRNATRYSHDVCMNFLLGLPCHINFCNFRHDVDLRDTLNEVRSYSSTPFMDGAFSDKTSAFSGENHKQTSEAHGEFRRTSVIPNEDKHTEESLNEIKGAAVALSGHKHTSQARFEQPPVVAMAPKSTNTCETICFNYIFRIPCHAGLRCRYKHLDELRAQTGGQTCRSFAMGIRCKEGSSCRFYHDLRLREALRNLNSVKVTTPVISKAVSKVVSKVASKVASKVDTKVDFKVDFKVDSKVESKVDSRIYSKIDSKIDTKTSLIQAKQKVSTASKVDSRTLVTAAKQSTLASSKVDSKTKPILGKKRSKDSSRSIRTRSAASAASINSLLSEKSEGAAAWGNFAANIAVEDAKATEVARARTNNSGQSHFSLNTVFKEVSITDRETQKTAHTSEKLPKLTSRAVSYTVSNVPTTNITAANTPNNTTKNTMGQPTNLSPLASSLVNRNGNAKVTSNGPMKLTRYCPHFHGGRYFCAKGERCDKIHDPELQKIYKSKDPQFRNTTPQATRAKSAQWPKNSYGGGWSLTITPIVPPDKAEGQFVRLPLLPPEIRLKIWEHCLSIPYSPVVVQRFQNERSPKPTAKYVSITSPPPLLEICHESRVEALKYYKLCLGTVTSPPRIYLNYDTSYVYLSTRRSGYFFPMVQCLLPVDLNNIQNLTLKLRDWLINDDCQFRNAIWKFPNLKNLQLFISSRDEDEEFRTPVAVQILKSVLRFQAEELNPGYKMPHVSVHVLPGLEIDSEPAEYAPPATRGERMLEYYHDLQMKALFNSAV